MSRRLLLDTVIYSKQTFRSAESLIKCQQTVIKRTNFLKKNKTLFIFFHNLCINRTLFINDPLTPQEFSLSKRTVDCRFQKKQKEPFLKAGQCQQKLVELHRRADSLQVFCAPTLCYAVKICSSHFCS